MNTSFLILVAAPLVFYIIALLLSLQNTTYQESVDRAHASDKKEKQAEPQSSHTAIASPETVAETYPEPAVAETPVAPENAAPLAAPDTIAIENAPAHEDAVKAIAAPIALTQIAATQENTVPAETVAPDEKEIEPAESIAAGPETLALVAPAETDNEIASPEASDLPPDDESFGLSGPLEFPAKGSPKYMFDYRGRLWVEKKRKSFFRQLRRPQLPPDEPQ